MNKIYLLWFLGLYMFLTTNCLHAQSSMQIISQLCEYRKNPLGIDTSVPRFTWQFSDSKSTRGQEQTAYHVLVSSTKVLLEKGIGDLWDSGKVKTSQSALVEYAGKPLKSNQDCYWKVRAYDKDGKVTKWGPVSRFSIGLLSSSDWKSIWIHCPDATGEQHIWYRKNIEISSQKVQNAFIHVASMGYHELYVNGEKVDDRVLAPALTRLDKRVLYVTYDIAPLLKKGMNTLAFWTGPGWSRYEYFNKTVHPALRAQLNIKTANGESFIVGTDKSWRCQISSSKNTGYSKYRDNGGECIDARKYIPTWNSVNFDDSQWKTAKETNFKVTLSAHNIEPSKIIETIHAKTTTVLHSQTYKVDMGKNFTGWIKVKMRGMKEGDTVLIRIADDIHTLQDFGQKNIYVCRGDKEEVFCNRFNFIAGRYINISGLKQKPQLSDVTGYAIGTDLERTGNFSCSEPIFNNIYETDLWTYRVCTTEGYTSDCPHRERLGYGEEVFATAWGIGFPNYQVGAFYQKHVRDWTDVQERNGWIHHTAPQINEHFGGPLWSSAGMNISWEYYINYGDHRILEMIYPSAVKWLEFLYRNSEWGLLENYSKDGKFLGDWAGPGQKKEFGGTPEAFYFNNCVYAYNLLTAIRMAEVLNKQEDIKLYTRRLNALKKRINAHFLDTDTHVYMDGNQVQTAFSLWLDIAPDSLRPTLMKSFERNITEEYPYLDMGSSGLPVLLKFLTEKTRQFDEAVASALRSTEEPSYGYFLKRGETAWPEYWNVDVPSRIHTCYTGIASWFMKNLGGICPNPEKPGCQSFFVRPSFINGISFVKAATALLYGIIRSEWRKEKEYVYFNITVPVNSEAIIYIPVDQSQLVFESNQPITQHKDITVVGKAEKAIIVRVKSGSYHFRSKYLSITKQYK